MPTTGYQSGASSMRIDYRRGHCSRSNRADPRVRCSQGLLRILASIELVEVLQQSLEAARARSRMQIDAADLLDQLLQSLELLQTEQ